MGNAKFAAVMGTILWWIPLVILACAFWPAWVFVVVTPFVMLAKAKKMKTGRCPNCGGTIITDKAKKCGSCGHRIVLRGDHLEDVT